MEPPQTSIQEKINILEKTLSVMGNEEPILAGRKEPEWHQKKLEGPKNTAKQIRGETKLDQHKTHRDRSRVVGGDADKHQDTGESTEGGIRRNRETPDRAGAVRRIDEQKQEPCPVTRERRGSEKSLDSGAVSETSSCYETTGRCSERRDAKRDCEL